MIWGVGTGRCGTKSLAETIGGVHEPQPWLLDEPVRYLLGETELKDVLIEKLRARLELGVPIVDLKNSYLIDLIIEVDPSAQFIWMWRDPEDCIRSFLAGGSWTEQDDFGAKKLRPKFGWQPEATRLDKAIWYWREVNHFLDINLMWSTFEVWKTTELPVHENQHVKSGEWVWGGENLRRIIRETAQVRASLITRSRQERPLFNKYVSSS